MKKMKHNSMIVHFITSITKLFVLLLICSAGFIFVHIAEAATMSVSPGTGVYTAGQTFTTRVVVNTQGDPINAAEATLSFNPAELSVVSITKGSIFNLWTVDPTFSNAAGTVTFGGGSPSGYTGANGTILTITFRSKAAGTARVSFANGSVLAADGLGTNVLRSMNSGAYTISSAAVTPEPEVIEYIAPANTPAAPVVSSDTHPDPAEWYTDTTAVLTWSVPAGVTGVRTLLDVNSGSIPTKVYDTPLSSITLENLDEGVQYFHIQFRNSEGWGRVTHYRLAVDTTAPTGFTIAQAEDADLTNPNPTLQFTTDEATGSPITRYLIQLDGAEPYEFIDEEGAGAHTLEAQTPGYHTVIVEAFDAAGNSVVGSYSFNVLTFTKPQFTEYPTRLNEEVVPVLKGITKPGAVVTITMRQLGVTESEAETVYEQTTQSDDSGAFTFIPDGRLAIGTYEIVAIATDADGAQSEPSDAIRVIVEKPGYIALGGFLVSLLSIIVPLVALVLLLVLCVVYFIARFRKIRTYVVAETDEALQVMHQTIGQVRKTLRAQEQLLRDSRKTKKLTKTEATLIAAVAQELTAAEDKITKEISDVDDIVT